VLSNIIPVNLIDSLDKRAVTELPHVLSLFGDRGRVMGSWDDPPSSQRDEPHHESGGGNLDVTRAEATIRASNRMHGRQRQQREACAKFPRHLLRMPGFDRGDACADTVNGGCTSVALAQTYTIPHQRTRLVTDLGYAVQSSAGRGIAISPFQRQSFVRSPVEMMSKSGHLSEHFHQRFLYVLKNACRIRAIDITYGPCHHQT